MYCTGSFGTCQGHNAVPLRKGGYFMLRIEHFSKTYRGGKRAVDDLSLEIEAGDIYGFIGHNGAGKTTTIRAIVGVQSFEEGDIYIDGISVKKDPVSCKRMTVTICNITDSCISYMSKNCFR